MTAPDQLAAQLRASDDRYRRIAERVQQGQSVLPTVEPKKAQR